MADNDSQLPVRAIASQFTTEVANASGTTINPAEDYAQGSTTSGQNGILGQAAVTTAAPTYSTGQTSPLSMDTSGNLRVSATFTPSGTQNINVLQWDTTALGVPTAYGTAPSTGNYIGVNAFVTNTVAISAAALPLPTGASTSALQTTGNTSLASIVTNTNSLILAQGSTTSGQTGNLAMGAVTTAAPTYVTGQTDPFSLTTAGALRVDGSGSTQPISGTVTANQGTANATPWNENVAQWGGTNTSLGQKTMSASVPVVIASDQSPINVQFGGVTPVLTYFTDAAVASGATVTHSLTGPAVLDMIQCAESGSIKMTVAIGTTGSEAVVWNGFAGVPNSNATFAPPHPITLTGAQSAKVTLKNRDTTSLDTYLTFFSH